MDRDSLGNVSKKLTIADRLMAKVLKATSAMEAVQTSYASEKFDEFVLRQCD